MTSDDFPNIPVPPSAPPTRPGANAVPDAVSAWPTVIGIIATIFGAGGLLLSVWGMASPFLMDRWMTGMQDPRMSQMMSVPQWRTYTVVSSALSLGAAALLLGAGIGILQRRRWASRTSTTWAIVKMAVVLVGTALGYMTMQAQLGAMNAAAPTSMPAGVTTGMVAGGMCFGIVWGWALPIFVLIWFSRSRIKAEVATWT